MGLCAGAFCSPVEAIASLFSRDPEVIQLTAALLVFAAAFQVFDGAQVISMGALRGLKDVNIPTAIVFISFWVSGIPLGALLAFGAGYEARGLWIGLASGLGLASIVLFLCLTYKLRAPSMIHRRRRLSSTS